MGQLLSWRETQAPGPTRVQSLWWSLLGQIEAQRNLGPRVFAFARLELALLPKRPRVEIENGPRLCCGAVGSATSLGMGLRLGRLP